MRNMLMVAAMAALMATTLSAAEPNENCAVRIDAGKNANEQILANP